MLKKSTLIVGIIAIIYILTSGFESKKNQKVVGFHLNENEVLNYNVPTIEEVEDKKVVLFSKKKVPYARKSFKKFQKALAFRESGGNDTLINPYGYMGKYQFGKSTLRSIGVTDTLQFLQNPILQDKALTALLEKNKWELRKEIALYNGKILNGVEITESGILAAAHLGGAGSVKKYLRSNGKRGFKDKMGTSIGSYIIKFGGYDFSQIKANRKAKVQL